MKLKWKILVLIVATINLTLRADEKVILVTGGAGFIGSNFVKFMYDKYIDYKIIVLDKLTYAGNMDNIPQYIRNSSRFSFVHGDICDKELIDAAMSKVDIVVHFAAESDVTRSIRDDEPFFITNVLGTRNLLHYLVKYRKRIERFIHISSSEVFGTCLNESIDEDHPLNPMSPYAATKLAAERAVFAYGCTYDVPVTVLRFFNNYGPRQDPEKVIAKFISLALIGHPITVHGDGEQMRDWIHVDDTARAIDAAIHLADFESIRNECINCGTGKAISIIEIARRILAHVISDSPYVMFKNDRPGQVFKHIASTNKAKRLLNWEAKIDFEQGLVSTISWYKQHIDFYQNKIGNPEIFKDNSELVHEKEGNL